MNDDQLLRYSRQIMLSEWDVTCQEKALSSRVLVIGLGGLGCPASLYLAASGVGRLVLNDHDKVELSNLQRQICHGNNDIEQYKVDSARESILNINPSLDVQVIPHQLSEASLRQQVVEADVVLDGTDNFASRRLINRLCVETKTPLVSGAAIQMAGQVFIYNPCHDESPSPCYSCLFGELEDENLSCSENGIMAPVVGIIGSIMALETLKLLTEFYSALSAQLLILDARTLDWRKVAVRPDPQCAICAPSINQ
ncbi:MAG: molybdopterin-synthase adenylyltransferase MoeB [Gammaproteobacteria bacterium]|nr:MAG: molybdopterin-synthase adenylyltransferase MoeB [Gammaproteobacteria bacterium]